MELTRDTIKKLNTLIANPASVHADDLALLRKVATHYPYFQPVHLLVAKASYDHENRDHLLATAAIYNSSSLLHQLIYTPENLKSTDDFNVLNFVAKAPTAPDHLAEQEETEFISTEVSEPFFVQPEAKDQPTQHHLEIETVEQETNEDESFDAVMPSQEVTSDAPLEQEFDEQEIIEEINEFKDFNHLDFLPKDSAVETIEAESLAVSDFFAFENTIADTITDAKEAVIEEYDQNAEQESVISKYDDDKLPYTFLWWLAKTRKEHEQVFRPFVTAKPKSNVPAPAAPGQLQHQYVEHIFHIQTPFNEAEISKNNAAAEPVLHKGDEIIEKFIQNDPHIRALKPDQIDNENKAKKSAEDHYDLVSETLAEIYIEQVLYHKAIDTYQKLSLKFPEKSGYFADLIQSLEKKI